MANLLDSWLLSLIPNLSDTDVSGWPKQRISHHQVKVKRSLVNSLKGYFVFFNKSCLGLPFLKYDLQMKFQIKQSTRMTNQIKSKQVCDEKSCALITPTLNSQTLKMFSYVRKSQCSSPIVWGLIFFLVCADFPSWLIAGDSDHLCVGGETDSWLRSGSSLERFPPSQSCCNDLF